MCAYLCVRVCLCQWCVCTFPCQRCLCFACVCFVGIYGGISVFHPFSWGSMLSGYSEGQRWLRGRGVSHHCHPCISLSLHLSFHVFSSLSCVALGMWTLLNFPPCGWWRRQEGIRGVVPSLLLSSVSPLSFPRGDTGRRVHTVKRQLRFLCPLWALCFTTAPWFHLEVRVEKKRDLSILSQRSCCNLF